VIFGQFCKLPIILNKFICLVFGHTGQVEFYEVDQICGDFQMEVYAVFQVSEIVTS
jgi:hypothetical protein